MKRCSHCKESKSVDEFAFSNKLLGTRQKHCRSCMSKFNKASYQRNTEKHKERVKKTRTARKKVAKRYIWNYLSGHPCEICGEGDPRLLEFDHRNPKNKKHNVSEMVSWGYSLESIQKEIEKCQVLF